ncbi:MAG: adenosine deaminase [Chloroflexota bacterium]
MDRAVIRGLPKAELHQHLDGSVRPSTAVELGAALGMRFDLEEAERLLVAPAQGRDQAELLEYFDLPLELLQTAPALRRVTAELVADMAADGIVYGEIRWAPRLHLRGGLSVAAVIEAVADGVVDARGSLAAPMPQIGLIVTAMRSHPPLANVELARIAAAHATPVVGFDLAGPEAAFPAPPHAAAFRAAESDGLRLTAHAGEVPGSERIRDVIGLGIERIAHGVTVAADPELIELVRARDLTLDLCPTSNVQAGIVTSLAAHPLAVLHRAGVSVTLSTDDRTVSGTTLTDEIIAVSAALELGADELAAIALNAFDRAFAPSAVIEPLRRDAVAAWNAWASGTIIR